MKEIINPKMTYRSLVEKQVELDTVLGHYHEARLATTWNNKDAEQIASQLESLLKDEYGQRHRITIVTKLQGNQPIGTYNAIAIGGELQLRHSNETARAYSLLGVTRIEFKRSEIPSSRTPTQTDGELTPLTDAEARRMIKKWS